MKISLKQLEQTIKTIRNTYAKLESEDLAISISITEGDPGNGQLLASFALEVSASEHSLERDRNLSVHGKYELFDKHEKLDPIGTLNLVHKLSSR